MTEDHNNPESEAPTSPDSQSPEGDDIEAVALSELEAQESGSGLRLPPALLDPILLDLTVELGRTEITFRELQALTQGAVIELEHLVGDPLEIRANGHLVARGEVVAVKQEHYGVRITEVVQPARAGEDDA